MYFQAASAVEVAFETKRNKMEKLGLTVQSFVIADEAPKCP